MYLGLDLGTSAIKLCVIDAGGRVVATAHSALASSHPFAGASEQDPRDWWQALCIATSELSADVRGHIDAIGLSGQMHGAVMLDADGAPLMPAILWNDGRAEAECDTILRAVPSVGDLAGVLPMPGFTAPKLLWVQRQRPDVYARIAHVLQPKDYIGYRLHGRFVTDPSDASGTLWCDIAGRVWSEELCAASATDPRWLPEIREGAEVAGLLSDAAASALRLRPGIPVTAGAGDAAAGAVGIGAVRAGDGFISLGTSAQLFVTSDAHRPNAAHRLHAYAHTVPGHWFQMAAMLNGARPIAWLATLLGRPIGELLAQAETAAPGPLFLPYLTGERTPHGDSDVRAGFWGLGEDASPGGLMRSVLEGIAFSFADAMDVVGGAGAVPDTLLAIGGGTRSALLMQMIADVLDCPIGCSADAEIGPALGASRLAQVATGADAETVLRRPEIETWYRPRAGVGAELAPRLAGYRALYPALKAVDQALIDASRC